MPRNHPRNSGGTTASDWVNLETKVPDEVPLAQNQTITVRSASKKGKGRAIKLHIPRSMIPELKRMFSYAWDQETLDAPSGSASQLSLLSYIVQGVNSTNRVGDSIFVRNIVFRIDIVQSAGNNTTTVSLAVVKDKEPAAGVPAWTDMFQGIGAASANMYNVAIPNYDERSRFQYMRRLTKPLVWQAAYYNAATFGTPQIENYTLDVPINQRVQYNTNNGAPYSGAEIIFVAWSDLTSNVPKANLSFEIFFDDA